MSRGLGSGDCVLVRHRAGCPVAMEVFDGNPADPRTLASQIQKLRERFGLTRVVLVGGLSTDARWREDVKAVEGLDWISALRLGRVVNRFKVAKHFVFTINEASLTYERDTLSIAAEAALDGLYVIRTSVPAEALTAPQTVEAYKGLSVVERAFRSYTSVDLKVRPLYHHLADRVRAHLVLCMLACSVEWHMRQALAPLLFDDDDKARAAAQRASIVAPVQVSDSARRKARTQRTDEGLPVRSFQTLLADLATIVKNRIQPNVPGASTFDQITRPTALQQRALDLLAVRL